jgi:hypothetical protein
VFPLDSGPEGSEKAIRRRSLITKATSVPGYPGTVPPTFSPTPRMMSNAWPGPETKRDTHDGVAACSQPAWRLLGLALGLLAGLSLAPAQTQTPPPITINQNTGPLAPGYLFIGAEPSVSSALSGPEILDNQGRIVWFQAVPSGAVAADFRVQTYLGNPVLTWSQAAAYGTVNPPATVDYILDTSYNVVATVMGGNGFNADMHEFQLTPQGTALVPVYRTSPMDLSSVGGSVNGYVTEGVVQEINIATGAVILQWESLPDVALSESYMPVPATTTVNSPYDYFHLNSISLDTDGNILVSSRHTWTIYKLNRTTGAIMWRLGGKKSDFALGPGLPFAWQHDAVAVDAQTIRIFDNESDGAPVLPYSRALWVTHNDTAMTATVARQIVHPLRLSVLAEGSVQDLPNGNAFVEWGILGRISEFDSSGQLVFDASPFPGYSSYRGYRFPWTATPTTTPTASAFVNPDGSLVVEAMWNGATNVASWEVMGGTSADTLTTVATGPWNGFNTAFTLGAPVGTVEVIALDASGAVLSTSTPVSGPFPAAFTSVPASQTIAAGDTVVMKATASGTSPQYKWTFNGAPLSDGTSGGTTIAGSATATLVITGASASNAGTYACVGTNDSVPLTSSPAALAVMTTADPGRLINVSSRAEVGTGTSTLILGYTIGGALASGDESLLIRASGPALAPFGVTGFLPDPQLVLTPLNGAGATPLTLSAWAGNEQVAAVAAAVGAFAWTDPTSLDSATLQSFPIGSNTAEVQGASGDTGVSLVEIYDATPIGTYTPSIPHLTNVSARVEVGTGDQVPVTGFVVGGSTSKTVLIRASGPALAPFGLSGTLADPVLQLFGPGSESDPIASNGGWGGDPAVSSAAAVVGAFAWSDTTSHDAALLITLPPGPYTVEVTGQSGDTGLVLIEVYEDP